MKSLEQEIKDARKPICIWKEMLNCGNRLYVNISYKENMKQTMKCQECNGYNSRKRCYIEDKE